MLIDQYLAGLDNQELRRHVQFALSQSVYMTLLLVLGFKHFDGLGIVKANREIIYIYQAKKESHHLDIHQ